MKLKNRSGQVWIETVLYTLIGLALMGVVLAFVTPKLNAEKDRIVVEQTISALNAFDEHINTVLQAPGNVRQLSLNMQRGAFYINGTGDSLVFIINDLSAPYSEPGVPIIIGRVSVLSEKTQKGGSVSLTLKYLDNITYNQQDEVKIFTATSIPYTFSISNLGVLDRTSGKSVISITEVS